MQYRSARPPSQRTFNLRLTGLYWGIFAAVTSAFASVRADAAVAPPPFTVEDGNTYDFYVADQEQYDSNLYRLPSGFGDITTIVAPNASRSDFINSISAGGDAQWVTGRQVFELNLRADENLFAHNSVLNNASGYGNLLWNWQVGPQFSGEAGVTYNHGLASFAETRELGRDLTDTTRAFGTARYQIGPTWAVYGGISDLQISHSAQQARFNDFHLKGGDAGIEYATSGSDTLALEYGYSDGQFPTSNVIESDNQSFTPNYHEQITRLLFKYLISDKTELDAYAGYRKRDFTTTSVGAFSGDVWRVSISWQPTDKTQIVFAGWHELHSYLVAESDYFISKGGSISPTWNATEKFKFALVFSYEDQDYVSESPSVVVLGPLNAKIATEQVNVTFTPRSSWIFNLAFNHQQRNSNQVTYQFGDDLATISVLYKIH
jgi:hypothetical protein